MSQPTPGWDPHAVLGVRPGATRAEIRRAYRRLAKLYHPDANGGDATFAERFKEVQRAYEVLTDEHVPSEMSHRRPSAPPMDDTHPFARFWEAYVAQRDRRASGPVTGEARGSEG